MPGPMTDTTPLAAMSPRSTPLSTYRLQITASFNLDTAATIIGYVRDLGSDWVYLSPLLKAESGSDHGYDVVDHSLVDPARGGAAGLSRLAVAAHQAGLGVLVDIVPNHVGVATAQQNAWWWDLLQNGQQSRYAEAFDVDWAFGNGRIRIPVLGDVAGNDVAGGDAPREIDRLQIVEGELRYFDNHFPIAPGTANDGASPVEVHDRQHYELVNWRRADADLNYRRFFAVNSLAGIRVEVPWVFEESHREIIRWVHDGLVQGLRVDHPDGLADPAGYLDALRRATNGVYVLVEKILEGREELPTSWATAGTTGYDALADVDRVLVDSAGQNALDELESRLQGENMAAWVDVVARNKRAVADGILRSEVLRIARLVPNAPESPVLQGDDSTADALAELLAWFPVYRSYLPVGLENLQKAAQLSSAHRPELEGEIQRLLPLLGDPEHAAAVRFQQTSGMVMAKGVEDRAYYRFSRLTSLNEVGADPDEFTVSVSTFHDRQRTRQAGFPNSMTTLSTHDTKRGEDVRARISVLAEIPTEWEATVKQLRVQHPLGDAPFENLLWQAIIGAWPASRERLAAYALKAAREAGTSTTWTQPNTDFEESLNNLVTAVTAPGTAHDLVTGLVDRVRHSGWSNSLSLKMLQLTMPGVPDVYQGSELWETSLVDPDNRRPVDYGLRRELLSRIDSGWLPPIDETGAAKLLVTSRALRLRRDRPDLFLRYAPVAAFGVRADHVVAFDRGGAITLATRLPIGLHTAHGWGNTTIAVASRGYINVLTQERYDGPNLRVADLLARYPVALLVAVDDQDPLPAPTGRHA